MNYAEVTNLHTIHMEDIPAELHDIVDTLSMPAFLKFVHFCGKHSLYIPKLNSLERTGRNQ